jgi:hypothetical protein
VTQNISSICQFDGHFDPKYTKVSKAIRAVHSEADRQRGFMEALKFAQINTRLEIIKIAHAETCEWLLKKGEFHEWLDDTKMSQHHGFLWIKGKPGSGKSTLMKYAYSNAKETLVHDTLISFFFNARGEKLEKSALGMYRSLLFQLLEKLPPLQNVLNRLSGNVANNLNIESIKNLLSCAIKRLGRHRLTCFIDALDECEEDEVRELVSFFSDLGQFAISSRIRFRICFSSRHYPHITIEKGISLVLDTQEGHQQDIARYIHSELKCGQSNLAKQIKDKILQRASGVFLWVVLVVHILNKEFDRGRIHSLGKRLYEIPDRLDELFHDILIRDGQDLEDLTLCLQWVLYAARPLRIEELYLAILVGLHPEKMATWNREVTTKEDMERYILSSSKGFVEVSKSPNQTCQFIHESVREFVLHENGIHKIEPRLKDNVYGLSHERLKQCCQAYVSIATYKHQDRHILSTAATSIGTEYFKESVSATFPFLEYSIRNLLYHANIAGESGLSQTSFIRSLIARDWIHLYNLVESRQWLHHAPGNSLLYVLVEQDCPSLIHIEMKRVQHMDIKEGHRGFPSHVALANGNEKTLQALLTPDTGTWSDNSVTWNGVSIVNMEHQKLVRFILERRNAIILRKDRSLLMWAAEGGHEAVVKLLLETGKVEVESKDLSGMTPLSIAAKSGHNAVVALLLETKKVNVDLRDWAGQTPLSLAAQRGHRRVVKLLLETGKVNVQSRDVLGRTPLSLATRMGHEAIVKILLERKWGSSE